jgi:hypothetical protein
MREGIVSLIDCDEYVNHGYVNIMWLSPEGIAHDDSIHINDIKLTVISEKEYKDILEKIDYRNNNMMAKIFDDELTRLKKEEITQKVNFKVVK